MATFVLIHGAGSDPWYWHRVIPLLDGYDAIAVDLPCDDDSAGLSDYADAIARAIGDRRDVVLVAQSLAGFSAPLAHERASLIVLLNAMIPAPGETAGAWWENTGQPSAMLELAKRLDRNPSSPDELMNDAEYLFVHDLPSDLAAESVKHVRNQSGRPFGDTWPLDAWPDVATHVLVGRNDRLFPADFQYRVAEERLGITPEEIDGGHLAALSRPDDVARRLIAYL
jgi:pimeloyl-ACP methyl ester carboxylesterase